MANESESSEFVPQVEKFILICATGRSGSTSLQRIINLIPNSNITGEKNGVIEDLLLTYKKIKNIIHTTLMTYEEIKIANIKPAWYNCYDIEEVRKNIKKTIVSILTKNNCNYRVLGYKEIRWCNNLHLLDEFLELFPNTKIICHLSDNLDKQICSDWWSEDKEASRIHLLKYNEQLIQRASNDRTNCYLSYMKNLFDVEEVKKMFLFLEEPFEDETGYNFIINNNLG